MALTLRAHVHSIAVRWSQTAERSYTLAEFQFQCPRCHVTAEAGVRALSCAACGEPPVVAYDASGSRKRAQAQSGQEIPLPLKDPASRVTLGEGNTPVVRLPAVERALGLGDVRGKLELVNPTGSFKDRGAAVMMSAMVEHGVGEVVEDSSGNAGAAVAAYAARAGIRAHVFVPASAPAAKLRQIEAYGAQTHPTTGTRDEVTEAAVEFCENNDLAYASHNLSPYFLEGTKSFAYEVADRTPRHLVVPVGNGSLLIGAHKGYREMIESGAVDAMPRLHCVQAEAVMPIAAAFSGEPWSASEAGATIAGGIAVGTPPRSEQVLDAVRTSGGSACAVAEEDILRWQRFLAVSEGVYCEATSAAAFAGLEGLVRKGVIGPSEGVLVPVTGSGLKDAPQTG